MREVIAAMEFYYVDAVRKRGRWSTHDLRDMRE
jgi:hypothetical protein